MKISNWITKVANLDEATPEVTKTPETNSLNLAAYEQLLKKKADGTLKDEDASTLNEIEELLKVAIKAAEQLVGVKKEAATPMFPKQQRDVLPPKIKEPETTKWKEIRFNKRTGTWQVVITTRHVRNFLTENEAIDFTKKASLNAKAISATQVQALLDRWSRGIDQYASQLEAENVKGLDDEQLKRHAAWLREMKGTLDRITSEPITVDPTVPKWVEKDKGTSSFIETDSPPAL